MAFSAILRKSAYSLVPTASRLARANRNFYSSVFSTSSHLNRKPSLGSFVPGFEFSSATETKNCSSNESLLQAIESEFKRIGHVRQYFIAVSVVVIMLLLRVNSSPSSPTHSTVNLCKLRRRLSDSSSVSSFTEIVINLLLLCRLDPDPPFGSGSQPSSLPSFIVDPVLSLLLRRRSEWFIIDLVIKLLLHRRRLDVLYRRPNNLSELTVTPALLLHRRRMDTLSPEKSGGAGFLRPILLRHRLPTVDNTVEETPSEFTFKLNRDFNKGGRANAKLTKKFKGELVEVYSIYINQSDLDENMKKAFQKYLEIRGIKPSMVEFLQKGIRNKYNQINLTVLKKIKNFIEQVA
ncbi:hypothetical protein EZV62_025715 [Acer yangbiense]|uniref:Uncharacterized protein n=1 Tax=Acer yangbiense TaxID=1000413 RepID=A0A5C7GYM3_9ROSI|nr:hypothetical protein EZV62_025715 [Acer yangbiense]